MPADNTVYDRATWWDEYSFLYALHVMTPPRFTYLYRTLVARQIMPEGAHLLDIGCGAGFLSERFAACGFRVTGIDPSAVTIAQAHAHAKGNGVAVSYLIACGESIPCPDATFDAVYCCDVLEHVHDLDRVIAESARVLRPGGLFLFDTINRTLLSKFVVITLFQEWRPSRFVDFPFHDWHTFIRPRELRVILARHGLMPCETRGLNPGGNLPRLLRALIRLKRGTITYGDLEREAHLVVTGPPLILYVGYATKGQW